VSKVKPGIQSHRDHLSTDSDLRAQHLDLLQAAGICGPTFGRTARFGAAIRSSDAPSSIAKRGRRRAAQSVRWPKCHRRRRWLGFDRSAPRPCLVAAPGPQSGRDWLVARGGTAHMRLPADSGGHGRDRAADAGSEDWQSLLWIRAAYDGWDHRVRLGGSPSRTPHHARIETCQLSRLRSAFHAHATTPRPIYS
jgi:hypothetical protein